MSRAKARVIVEYKGKKYRLHGRGKCGTKSCALFKKGVCDNDDDRRLPCDALYNAIEQAHNYSVWKEVE